jgi:hypothetical protein
MKKLLIIGIASLTLLFYSSVYAQTTVTIASPTSEQHPFVFNDGSGLAEDIIDLLNETQNKYKFQHILLPTKRLYKNMIEGKLDGTTFNNIDWGWEKNKVKKSNDLIQDQDVFLSLKSQNIEESYFDNIGKVKTVGVLGYFYTFTGFNDDQQLLKTKYNMALVKSEAKVADLLIKGRGKIGIMASTLLDFIKVNDNEKYNKLYISKRYDSKYTRHFLVYNDSPLSVAELNNYFKKLNSEGKLKQAFSKYGLQTPRFN